ncbi:acylneuraminate cytidylyltransferase family protein [bacterium AH-315-F18]|nr:acylneuraminate cytidylyltransferase family protein [bacterium AH-315-F18]
MTEPEHKAARLLGLIPARGGSKGIPRKNLAEVGGRPLLAHAIEAALGCALIHRTVVSTDDAEIAEMARTLGAEVPFTRPAELGQDDTPTLPVIQHALKFFEDLGEHFDAVVLLQPTTPFRTPDDMVRACSLFSEQRPDAVISVLPVPDHLHPHRTFVEEGGWLTPVQKPIPTRRQDLPDAWHGDGAIYVLSRATLMEANRLLGERVLGLPMNPDRSVNIDSPEDLERARKLLRPE